MKVSELDKALLKAGCNPKSYAIMQSSHDAFCINKRLDKWIMFYSERGNDSEPIYTTGDESDACSYFYNYITKLEHLHIVGFFKNEQDAINLEDKLKRYGITHKRNDIPSYKFIGDARFRVFVIGTDIFKFYEHFGKIEIKYA